VCARAPEGDVGVWATKDVELIRIFKNIFVRMV
jgi:hypothetical protein